MWRALRHRRSLQAGIALGLLAGLAAALLGAPPSTALLIGWSSGALAHMAPLFLAMQRSSPRKLKERAALLDDGQWGVLFTSAGACVASLIVVLWHFRVAQAQESALQTVLGLATIVISWLLVHVIFAAHYCHEFWQHGGGIEFPGEKDATPDFLEFLYFSLTIGMTFQVSDVSTTSPAIRRVVILHGLISFVFNAVIIACGVNLASQFLQ